MITNHPELPFAVTKKDDDGHVTVSARFAHAEDAAMAVANGTGTCVYYTDEGVHERVVWREGREEIAAAESYDRAAEIMWSKARADLAGRAERWMTAGRAES